MTASDTAQSVKPPSLLRWARHDDFCPLSFARSEVGGICTCGLDAAILAGDRPDRRDLQLAAIQSMLPNIVRYSRDEYRRAKLARIWWLIQKVRLA